MQTSKIDLQLGIVSLFILVAAISRLFLVGIPNFSPLGAIALFGAAYFSHRYLAFLIPLAGLWLSDLLLNNIVYAAYYDGFVWFTQGAIWIYIAFVAVILLGMARLQHISLGRIAGSSVLAAVLFFMVTNFGVWMSSGMYPKNVAGLVACYAAAIPFFWSTLVSNLLFAAVLFGGYAWVKNHIPAFQNA